MLKQVLEQFSNPGSEYRGAPFWAWNAKLEPEELRRQIRFMKEMGFGGFFMHSRVGLNTPYLSGEWFDCIRACIDEAKKLGMMSWLYDEDRWPSGAAGGLVTKDPRFRQRHLKMDVLDSVPENRTDRLAVFAARIDGSHASGVRRLLKGDVPAAGEKVLLFYVQECELSSWYNGQTYLDTMNDAAVNKFIEVTHEAYKREVSKDFGTRIPGIFTDEPNYLHGGGTVVAWTPSIPERFRAKFGYDLLDRLPELFYVVDGVAFSKVRLNFRDLCTELFVNAFGKLIGNWCEKNKLEMTGHVLCEDDVVAQTHIVGSAMRFYEFMQTPGIDLLTEHWGIFLTAKQCTSVAHQFGRARRLSETYGCTGWDFPFAGHKTCGDWQYALGINYRCQHLAWYSMAAEAKRDYPASISYQSPWYSYYDTVESYFGRLGAALSEGEERRELLVIHPIESTWGIFVPADNGTPEMACEARSLVHLTNRILAENIDFDFGEEEMMSRLGAVKNARIFVHKASYNTVLLPEMRTIRKTTLELLKRFADNGGKVFYMGNPPEFTDGEKSSFAKEIYKGFQPVTEDTFAKKVGASARLVSIADSDGREIGPVLHIQKKAKDHTVLFICNHSVDFQDADREYCLVRDRKQAFPFAKVKVKGAPGASVFELDLSSGKIWKIKSAFSKGVYSFETSFEPLESRLFFLTKNKIADTSAPTAALACRAVESLPERGWSFTPEDFNVLVLDHARYAVNGGSESEKKFILKIDDELREKELGVSPRGGAMVQPWLNAKAPVPEKVLDLVLSYSFECSHLPDSDCFLALERPELYEIEVNGRPLEKTDAGFWCDICIRRLVMKPESLKIGKNTILLKSKYHPYLPGLESIFLLGNFGVRGETILQMPETLSVGDWVEQGFSNYAGNMIYRTTVNLCKAEGNRVALSIPDWRGVALAVSVNGSPRRMLAWPPYELDITREAKDGRNIIEITVFGHRRNSHGPFYLNTKWPAWTGPWQFKQYEVSEKQLVPCGLLQAPLLKRF